MNRDGASITAPLRESSTSEFRILLEDSTRVSRKSGSHSAVASRHSKSRHRRPGNHTSRLVAFVCAALLAITGILAIVGAGRPGNAVATVERVIAADAMNRTVAKGFGSANTGGRYTVASASLTRVVPGSAQITTLKPAWSASALLTSATGLDTRMLVTFSISALPRAGTGLYTGLILRRQADGTSYRAKLRIRPNGTVSLGFSRVHGAETFLGGETILAQRIAPGQSWTLEARATGTTVVTLQSRAWPTVAATPSNWQRTVTDASSARDGATGSIGYWAYSSANSGNILAVRLSRLSAYATISATAPKPPSDVTPPATSSSPAAQPSTTTPAPTSPATSTSSAAPTPAPTTAAPAPGGSTSSARGAAPLGSANYPIPSGAVFVSPSGSDSASGSESAPVHSIAKAVSLAASGGTLVLRGGTYHETVDVPSTKSLTIQNYPGEAVWVDGSTPVSGWQQSGNTWVHSGWTAQFDSTAGYTRGSAPSGANWSFVNPAYPMAAHPDQAWLDGARLRQVGSAAEVTPGTFYVDYSNAQLVIGDDPNGHQVSATDLEIGMSLRSPNSTVRGIGVRRFATSIPDAGMVRLMGSNDLAENVIASESGSTGFTVLSTHSTLSHVTAQDNAMLGIHANYADGITVTGVLSQDNNIEHFNYSPVSGGLKITRTRGVNISDSDFLNNLGVGVWLDESVYNANVTTSRMINNASHGLSFEISSTGVLANNVVTGNGYDGFKINDSDHVRIWNNQISNNSRNIELVEDARRGANLSDPGHDPRQTLPDPTEPWIVRDIQVMNNVIGSPAAGSYEIYARDYSGQYTAAQLNLDIDGNLFTKVSSGGEIVWGLANNATAVYTSVAAFQAATGTGANNGEVSPGANAAAVSSSTAGASPLPLPADVAALIGQAPGTRRLGTF